METGSDLNMTTCVLCLARVVLQASVVLYPLVYYIHCNNYIHEVLQVNVAMVWKWLIKLI